VIEEIQFRVPVLTDLQQRFQFKLPMSFLHLVGYRLFWAVLSQSLPRKLFAFALYTQLNTDL